MEIPVNEEQLTDLLYQALETEMGGVQVYAAALRCVQNDELREEFQKYHEQTTGHVHIVQDVFAAFGLDPATETAGRLVVRRISHSLVQAMEQALEAGPPAAAELVAAECVVLAETKDHLNWELLGAVVDKLSGERKQALKDAVEQIEKQEDEHLYHSTGWGRELWMKSLGLAAALPPPEEQKHVTSAIGAARAKNARSEMAHR
jgi:ferritin-like metal-binding protein YciE